MSISGQTLLLLLLALVHGSIQKSTPESPTYRAAVVEFRSEESCNDTGRIMNENTEKIIKYIELAAKKNVDILVLPELSLPGITLVDREHIIIRSTLLPDPSENYAPCTNVSFPIIETLRRIACAVDRNDVYTVINLLEKEVCPPSDDDCPSDGVFLYVTTVIFDRDGKLIARYRKSHLDVEQGKVNAKKVPEISTFDTDFGVTFGQITCFDLLFEEPALTYTRELNITDIIYTSGWFSEIPFRNGIGMESGWAYVEDVNMLASGHNYIHDGYSGSGIFAGRQGIISSILILDDQEEIIVADVPKKSNKNENAPAFQNNEGNQLDLENLYTERLGFDRSHEGWEFSFAWDYEKLDKYESRAIDSNGYTEQSLSHFGIDCEFRVNVTDLNPPETYRLLAFDDLRVWSDWTELGTKTCAIVYCSNQTIDSCGHVGNSSAIINHIAVKASYVDKPRVTLMPSTLGSDMLPLDNWTFDQYKQEGRVHTTMSSTVPTEKLVTFGISGRDFDKDVFKIGTLAEMADLCEQDRM